MLTNNMWAICRKGKYKLYFYYLIIYEKRNFFIMRSSFIQRAIHVIVKIYN